MSKLTSFFLFLTGTVVFFLFSCGKYSDDAGGVPADEALATFRIADGFKIEMIAAEPLVSDPVDMEIDEHGNMFVVEMHGYPLDKSGSGNIIRLKDNDGDGVMDERVVFRENLVLPTGVMKWKNGLIITDAPNVLYIEDGDGDGVAEKTDTLLTGFALTNPQHNLNNPVYGLDNWIYVAHEKAVGTTTYKEEFGDAGTEIFSPADRNMPKLPVNADGRSVRFRPGKNMLEMTASACQFGHTFDRWGHWFGCNNSNTGYHEVVANRYFERNKDLLVSDAVQNMSTYRGATEVFPVTTNPDRQLLTDVGVITSACGITAYLGDAFPEPYNSNVTFVAEPVSNLVRADIFTDAGASFTAKRVTEQKEFLASTDAWSRPVNCYVGPDGALYVLDYYRQIIESPEWMSEEAIAAGGLYNGSDKGRIYRITPVSMKSADWTRGLNLGKAGSKELVQHLKKRNAWWRTHAQRLLIDRNDTAVEPALLAMVNDPSSETGRLHALWTLEGMGRMNGDVIMQCLRDTVAGIRENAIRVAELHLREFPGLIRQLLNMQHDTDPKVKFQLLLTLGDVHSTEADNIRNALLFSNITDKWMQIAAMSSVGNKEMLLNTMIGKYDPAVPEHADFLERLAAMTGASGDARETNRLIQLAVKPSGSKNQVWQAAVLDGLSQGWRRRTSNNSLNPVQEKMLVKTFFTTSSTALRNATIKLLKTSGIRDRYLLHESVDKAALLAMDGGANEQLRAAAATFLSLSDAAAYSGTLKQLVLARQRPVLQLAALATLSDIPGTGTSEFLIANWSGLTPEIRSAAISTFMKDNNRIGLLLTSIENKKIEASSVSFGNSVQLMLNKDSSLRERARILFTKDKEEAKKLSREYRQALDLSGDISRGREVYIKKCAICHQVRGKSGIAIGPDLGTVRNWLKEDILANIVDPNLSISGGFDQWNIEMNDGEITQGIIVSETAAAITLRNNGQLDRTISRQDIKTIQSAGISAMPSGLAKNMTHQQMADLISFLRQN